MTAVFSHYKPKAPKSRIKLFRGFSGSRVNAGEHPPMKLKAIASTAVLTATLAFLPALILAANAGPTDSEIIAKARASYPLKTCLVSNEPLGSMGEAPGYIHRVTGQPARVVFFCCEGCTDDFKADPAKFLKKVDDAAKGKAPAPDKQAGEPASKKH